MSATRTTTLGLILCAFVTVPAFGQTVTNWTDTQDNNWDRDLSWDNGVPDSSLDATHKTKSSAISVSITNAVCKSFEGDPGDPDDRFVIILGGKKLAVVNDLFATDDGNGRGRRISRAAKAHNANHLYANPQAAWADPAHPGDRSGVVAVAISRERHKQYFGTGRLSVDLRHVG